MASADGLAVAVLGAAIGGVGNGIQAVAARTALQEHVEHHWMGMMMGLNESLAQGAPGLGILIGGLLTDAAGPRVALSVAGAGAGLAAIASWIVLRPAVLRGTETMA